MDERSGDDLLERVVGELRELPPLDESRVRGIVAAAQAAGRDDAEEEESTVIPLAARRGWSRVRALPLAWAAGLVLAAGIGGYAVGESRGDAEPVRLASAPRGVESTPITPAALPADASAPLLTQFTIEAPAARQVSLVGDFNGWDAGVTPLVRDPASGLWSASVAVAPGRHTYAFMVDGKLTLDPRAPKSNDPELGTESSVVLVGGR